MLKIDRAEHTTRWRDGSKTGCAGSVNATYLTQGSLVHIHGNVAKDLFLALK